MLRAILNYYLNMLGHTTGAGLSAAACAGLATCDEELQPLMPSLPPRQHHQLWHRPNQRPRQTLHHKMHWYPLCLAGCTLLGAPAQTTFSMMVSLSCWQGLTGPAASIIRLLLKTWLLGLPRILRLLWPRWAGPLNKCDHMCQCTAGLYIQNYVHICLSM